MAVCHLEHFDKSLFPRYDFGPSFRNHRCSLCCKSTRNRGCQICGLILCAPGYALHIAASHPDKLPPLDRLPPTLALPRLHNSAEAGNVVEVLLLLRVQKLNVNGGRPFLGDDGVTPLMTAAAVGHVAVVQALAPHSDLNKRSLLGETALSFAAQRDNVDVVMALVQMDGLDANVERDDGITPLMTAAELGHVKVVEVLAPRSNLNLQNIQRHTALSLAAQRNNVDVVMKLLSVTGSTGEVKLDIKCGLAGTAAEIARREGHIHVADTLAESMSVGHRCKLLHEVTEGRASGVFDSMTERLLALYDALEEPMQPRRLEPERPTCIICMDAEVNAAIVPCFHAKFCETCASRVAREGRRCPECRGPVQRVQRIFL